MTVNEAVSMAITVLHECARAQQGDHHALAFDLQDAADALTARYKPRLLDESEVECYAELGLPIYIQNHDGDTEWALPTFGDPFGVRMLSDQIGLHTRNGARRRRYCTYNKEWRAWNTMPDPEDLATPWD